MHHKTLDKHNSQFTTYNLRIYTVLFPIRIHIKKQFCSDYNITLNIHLAAEKLKNIVTCLGKRQ